MENEKVPIFLKKQELFYNCVLILFSSTFFQLKPSVLVLIFEIIVDRHSTMD